MSFTRTNYIGLLPVLLLFSFTTTAQKVKEQKVKPPSVKNTLWVTYNPFNLIEPEIPIAVTVMYKPNNWLGLALDGGVFVARQDYSGGDANYQPYSGFRFKPEVKFYPDGAKDGPTGLYISLQGIIKKTSNPKEEWMSRNDVSGQTFFNQLVSYKEKKTVLGASFLVGGEFILGHQQRWMVEGYTGFGMRNKSFKAEGLPEGFSIDYNQRDNGRRTINIYRNGIYYTIALGFKVGYRIK